jgi:hypothetical protein
VANLPQVALDRVGGFKAVEEVLKRRTLLLLHSNLRLPRDTLKIESNDRLDFLYDHLFQMPQHHKEVS